MNNTDLIIIGGGAAGLMAGCISGELGLRTVILERKHKPGRKLLMCGNSRCNLTTNISAERMLQMYGEPVNTFLQRSITDFPPSQLQRWFSTNGLKTAVKAGNKVYPQSERASDVLHFFTDLLRDRNVSLSATTTVHDIRKTSNGFQVNTENFTIDGKNVILAAGGVSYPKTGSVGDGQKFATALGHTIVPMKAGLVGFEVDKKVLSGRIGQIYERVRLEIITGGTVIAETRGIYEIEKWGIGGTAITDASRIIARRAMKNYSFRIILENGRSETVKPLRPRPLKEAMVTVGGIALNEVNPSTMESKKCPGLYFAGEVLDIDGPTGGYNLHAAFATARLAVNAIGKRSGTAKPRTAVPRDPQPKKARKNTPYRRKKTGRRPG